MGVKARRSLALLTALALVEAGLGWLALRKNPSSVVLLDRSVRVAGGTEQELVVRAPD